MGNSPHLRSTRDYRKFSISPRNRAISPSHVSKLAISMKEYGWIPAFPMLVVRTDNGWEIIDGQHRFMVAQKLNLPVWFVEMEGSFDVAKINDPQVPWAIRDYTKHFSDLGYEAYREVVDFAAAHGMQIGTAAGLLCGAVNFGTVKKRWFAGTYKPTERGYAGRVALAYDALRNINREAVDRALLYALMAACRLTSFDPTRLIRKAKQRPELLKKYGTRDGALRMIEDIYNSGRGDKVPIHCDATAILAERNRSAGKQT